SVWTKAVLVLIVPGSAAPSVISWRPSSDSRDGRRLTGADRLRRRCENMDAISLHVTGCGHNSVAPGGVARWVGPSPTHGTKKFDTCYAVYVIIWIHALL